MRLDRSLVLAAFLTVPAVAHTQQPLPAPQSTTLVDVLSSNPNHTTLLKLLQRARLIPTLNRLNSSTLFAPTNDAVEKHPLWRGFLRDNFTPPVDNVQEQLRQQLFYHLLNKTISPLPSSERPEAYDTLHYPRAPEEPPSKDPPPSPPWMPIPGGTLGGKPQKLRVSSRDKDFWVGVDAFGENGSMILDHAEASNGVVYSISKVLEPPTDLAHIIARKPSVSYFHNVLNPEITRLLNATAALTLFLPVNAAWNALDPYERLYLESKYATDDLQRILNMHAVLEKGVRYSDSFQKSPNLTTIDGSTLQIHTSSGNTTVSGAKLIEPDIYASNGVLHLVDSLLVPPGAFQLTPEKYLLTLNCTAFVSLIHSVNLTSLINDTEARYTILAPTDDVLSGFHSGVLPEKGTEELKQALQYHFIPGRWTLKKLEDRMLLETELKEEGLGGRSQVLSVEVTSSADRKDTDKAVRFGGAGTIGAPVDVNSTIIYLLSRPLVPPVDALQAALPKLELSSFLAAVSSTSQSDNLKNTPRTSLLIPRNTAFQRIGMLVSSHLLSPSSKQDLENVLLHHALNTVEYAASLKNGSQHTFATLEGSDLQFNRLANGSLYVSPSGGWAGMKAEVHLTDTLTKTGVIHELSDLLLPRSVNLTVGKLVKAAQGTTMASLAIKAGFEWVLNGTAPPEDSPWGDEGFPGTGWTLLCPTDDAFKTYNLTKIFADVEGLRSLVAQHLIPPLPKGGSILDHEAFYNNRPVPFDDSSSYTTLHSSKSAYGDIAFRWRDDLKPNGYVVGIKGARGTDGNTDSARILSWGRSTTAGGGGVIQIDRLLVPYYPSWWFAYGAPAGVGVVGCLLICAFFYGVRLVWIRDTREATYEPVGGFGREDDEEE